MLQSMKRSLSDLLGQDYIQSVCRARSALTGEDPQALQTLADTPVEFFPEAFQNHQLELMAKVGTQVCPPAEASVRACGGAPSDAYRAAQNQDAAPMSGCGCFRLGEDGRIYFAGKSEHYHIPLGHDFPGYRLIEIAKQLGIPNATHNNTRGYITRLTEAKLIAAANEMQADDPAFEDLLKKREPGVLNRVINLETGSLVVEAALKMMLNPFYPFGKNPPVYPDRIPVFLVMADNDGGIAAGYHGTTFFAQILRGFWPEFAKKAEGLFRVESVRINDISSFADAIERWNKPPYKTAGFCHELVMMNYSGILLDRDYLQEAYRLCRAYDTPVLCDEIQSSAWYDTFFLFRKFGLTPDFVSIGKGFPGGNYPASKVLFSGAVDSLDQFGALVTNGQEELASLSYLITMEFLQVNGTEITKNSQYFHNRMLDLAARYPALCTSTEGDGFMSSLCFHKEEDAIAFCKEMNHTYCIDLSCQAYKANCRPAVLTKLPLITLPAMADVLTERMELCLQHLEENNA